MSQTIDLGRVTGPNLISTETETALSGLLKGNGSTVEAAVPGTDYAAGAHAATHAPGGSDPLDLEGMGTLNYDDIAGRSDSGSNPVLEGVFPGTELAHCILYGKSTQDGTPSPDASVDIVDYEPNEVWVAGRNFASFERPGYSADVASTKIIKNGMRLSSDDSVYAERCFVRYTLSNAIKGKKVTVAAKSTRASSSLQIGYTNHGEDVWSNILTLPTPPEGGIGTITIPETHPDYADICMALFAKPVSANDYCDFTDIMIVEGEYTAETMPPYTPYQGHTYPLSDLTLPGIPVDEGGNYTDESGQQYIADTYDVATGEYVQRVKKLVLDGTEEWATVATSSGSKYRLTLAISDILAVTPNTSIGTLRSTHYETLNATDTFFNLIGISLCENNAKAIMVYDPAYNTSDVSLWKAHLAELYAAGTPVTIRYALAEPIVSHRTPQQLPAPAPYTQVMAGGGHIAATLGNAMAPVKTTPQTLTAEQIKQVYINLNIPVPTYEYSDRDLSKVFSADELHAKIAAQDYSGIRMGDYWPITLSGTAHDYATDTDFALDETHLLEFMPNFYAESGDTATPPHILVCSRDLLSKTLQFRSADDVWYDTAATNPWLGSHLYQTLNNPDNGIIKLVRQTDIGQYLYAGPNGKGMRSIMETKAVGATTAASWAWSDRGKLFLPFEREVWGQDVWSERTYGGGGNALQWPIFAGSRRHIIKGLGNGGSRCTWWCASSHAGSAAYFCFVYTNGTASARGAAYAFGVPLCFLLT